MESPSPGQAFSSTVPVPQVVTPAESLVILGTGPAGLTAAIYAARAGLAPLVLEGVQPGGQLTTTTEIENFPGFPDGIQGFDLMENFHRQAERFGARFRTATVTGSELRGNGLQKLHLDDGSFLETKALIIATGAAARWIGLPSEEALKNKGVSACATCDGAFFRNVRIAVVGGGDTALEEALFLTRFGSEVVILHRRDQFRGSKIMQERVLQHKKIRVLWNRVVAEVLDPAQGKVTGLRLRDTVTGAVSTLECGALFVAIGHEPNTRAFSGQLELDPAGYIRLAGPGARTAVPGVFAAGDCVDQVYRQAITAAGTGCQAAMDAERWLAG